MKNPTLSQLNKITISFVFIFSITAIFIACQKNIKEKPDSQILESETKKKPGTEKLPEPCPYPCDDPACFPYSNYCGGSGNNVIPIVSITPINQVSVRNEVISSFQSLQVNFVSKDTFTLNDFHKKNISNIPFFLLNAESSSEKKFDGDKYANLTGFHRLKVIIDGDEIEGSKIESLNSLELNHNGYDDINFQAFGAARYFNIFYINFHNIKEEIVTQKTSWGNLKSFLGKHIQKIIDSDIDMNAKKDDFESKIKDATDDVLQNSNLKSFIDVIIQSCSNG